MTDGRETSKVSHSLLTSQEEDWGEPPVVTRSVDTNGLATSEVPGREVGPGPTSVCVKGSGVRTFERDWNREGSTFRGSKRPPSFVDSDNFLGTKRGRHVDDPLKSVRTSKSLAERRLGRRGWGEDSESVHIRCQVNCRVSTVQGVLRNRSL